MPTIGQESFFGRLERNAFREGSDRVDFLRLDFARESRARRFGVRFAIMAAFYVNCGLPSTQASVPSLTIPL